MASKRLKILFVATEVEDLAKTGGLADVAKALPLALTELGHDVRVVCPLYPQVRERLSGEQRGRTELSLQLGQDNLIYGVQPLSLQQLTVYSVDYPPYFARQGLYDNGYTPYADNGERFSFFSLAALHLIQALGFQPDIIHCNDWHTALLPFLLRQLLADNPFFHHTRTVLTLHNAAYQGVFELASLPLHQQLIPYLKSEWVEDGSRLNFLRCGIACADKVVAVSPTYARELLTPLGSHKLLPLFEKRRTDLVGILNGCNYQDWNPTSDPLLPVRYSASDLTGKGICKSHLQHYFGLQEAPDIPLFGMVSRLTEQKGFHLLLPALEQFLRQRVQVVIIGAGDPALATELSELTSRFPDQLKFMEGHTSRIAHWVVAGSDFFLMPSLFEPCGLTQMYALAYGSLPLVRAVGGLRDTVVPYRPDNLTIAANGLAFEQPSPAALLETLHLAQRLFCHDGTRYRVMQQQAMATRFNWSEAATAYLQVYQAALHFQFY